MYIASGGNRKHTRNKRLIVKESFRYYHGLLQVLNFMFIFYEFIHVCVSALNFLKDLFSQTTMLSSDVFLG